MMSPSSDEAPAKQAATKVVLPRRRRAPDTVGFIAWSAVVLLIGLALYYGWRATSNRDRLTARNLRELDRIGRTVEARLESLSDALGHLVEGSDTLAIQARLDSLKQLIPEVVDLEAPCHADPGIRVDEQIRICQGKDGASVEGVWTLAPIRRAMETDVFDEVFLTESGRVVVLDSVAAGIRVQEIPPPDSGVARDPRQSTVRHVTIGGQGYELFLQPLSIAAPGMAETPVGTAPRRVLGGLVSTGRFRAESLALGPRQLVFLGLVLILVILSLPFLRVTLIGPWEHVNVRDIYMLSVSLVLMSGLIGLALGDLTYYRRLKATMDADLDATAARLVGALTGEVRSALGEIVRRSSEFEWRDSVAGAWPDTVDPSLESRLRLFEDDSAGIGGPPSSPSTTPYRRFQMVYWTDGQGVQVAKWTPRRTNTPRVSVSDRPYFTQVERGNGWSMPGADIGLDSLSRVQYYLQSLRSKTTGEHVVALSVPFCWSRERWWRPGCSPDRLGVGVILTPLASVDQPVLPAGVEFAVIDPGGRTLFHSRPERVLDENFFEETDGNPTLRSLVAGRVSGRLNAVYMGRSTRMQVKPVPGTPLSLVVVLDDRYLSSTHFQTLGLALSIFGAWVLVLWGLFLFAELVTPGRLQWAWPARGEPQRYRTLVRILGAFTLLLVLQAVLAIWMPVHPSSAFVPLQALSLGLLTLTRGKPGIRYGVIPFWRTPGFLGWLGLGLSTVAQIVLHIGPGWPHLLLMALQLATVGWGCFLVIRFRPSSPEPHESARSVRRLYVASIALALGVVGLLPAVLLYEDAFAEHLERFVRHEQLQIVKRLRARADRVWETDRQGGLSQHYDTVALNDSVDLAFQGFLESRRVPPNPPLTDSGSCRWDRGATLNRLKPMIDTPRFYVTDIATWMGSLTRTRTEGYAWTCAGDTVQLATRRDTLRSRVPAGLWHPTEWWLPEVLVSLGILFLVPTWLGRRVFLLDLDDPGATILDEVLPHRSAAGRSLVVVCTRSMDRERLQEMLEERNIEYLDLLQVPEKDQDANELSLQRATGESGAICLDHFDQQLDQKMWARPLLARLEHLVFGQGRQVLLLTSREPSDLIPDLGEPGEAGSEERIRWTRLLGRFIKVRVAAFKAEREPAGPEKGPWPEGTAVERLSNAEREVLEHEAGTHPFLRSVAEEVAQHRRVRKPTADVLVDQVREAADGYYHALWSILEREEKVVVAQLARGVVVNPKCVRAIRRLLEREVVVLGPELRLMNESFARFIREEIPAGAVGRWEREVPASTWQRVRFPILLAVGAVAAFLFATQRGTFDTVIAILSTAAVGTTAAVRLISVARSGSGS